MLASKKTRLWLGGAILLTTFYFFSTIWMYLLIAAVVSLVGSSIFNLLLKIRIGRFGISKSVSAALSLLMLWSIIGLFFWIFVPMVIREINLLSQVNVNALRQYFEVPIQDLAILMRKFSVFSNSSDIELFIQNKMITLLSFDQAKDVFSSVASILGDIIIAIFAVSFISFFFLKDNTLVMKSILSFVPVEREMQTKAVVLKIVDLLRRYFFGLFIDVISVIFLITTGLTLVGIDFSHAIIIGLLAGFVNVIPYVGPIIGMSFGTIIGAASQLTQEVPENLTWVVLSIVAVFLAVQMIDAFLLQPFIYSSSVKAEPIEIFLVILMAGSMAGILGMILAVPSYTVLRVVAKEVFHDVKIVKYLTDDL